jgi:hypothetical protein
VTNNGIVPLTVSSVGIIGSDGDEFTLAGDGCSGTTVTPGNQCAISVRFKPVVAGAPIATLLIKSNSPTSPDGVGLDPPAYRAPSNAAAAPTAPQVHAAHASCSAARARHGRIRLSCTLPSGGKHAVTARLMRGRHVYASGTATVSGARAHLTLRPRGHVKAGAYTVSLSVAGKSLHESASTTVIVR